ncbi:MAG: hypothetical protein FWG25_06925 [Promicromonosporaceae bacterium]|nr:hypothetical protein [Promicromonosporaceae bacterium]
MMFFVLGNIPLMVESAELLDYPALARAIAPISDDDPVHCTRLVARAVQQLKSVTDPDELAEFHRQPLSTGDERWDALLAGVATHTWSLLGNDTALQWTLPLRELDNWWEPGNMPRKWQFWNMLHTPPSLRERRVIFPTQWLEAV